MDYCDYFEVNKTFDEKGKGVISKSKTQLAIARYGIPYIRTTSTITLTRSTH